MPRLLLRPLVLCASVLGLTGCPSPSIYGTARTTPVGEFSNTVSAEGVAVADEVVEGDGTTRKRILPLPSLPTYQLRYGAWDDTDFGIRLAHGGLLGIDVKHTFVETELIDVAIDPMLQVGYVPAAWGSSGETIFYAHLPAIIDFNLSESATLLLTPGGMFATADSSTDLAGVFARIGLGIQARVSHGFAIQPEVTLLKALSDAGDTPLLLTASLGFNFGALPEYAGAP